MLILTNTKIFAPSKHVCIIHYMILNRLNIISYYKRANYITFTDMYIAESPSDLTVYINQTAKFTCVINGTLSHWYWRVNGTSFNRLPSDVRTDMYPTQMTVGDTEEHSLNIPGKPEYNGTRVQCVAHYEGGDAESENATLMIQGSKSIIKIIIIIIIIIIYIYIYIYNGS